MQSDEKINHLLGVQIQSETLVVKISTEKEKEENTRSFSRAGKKKTDQYLRRTSGILRYRNFIHKRNALSANTKSAK
jgi:hypothetical protein